MEPLVSFVTPMKEQDFRVINLLKSIREQNYPQDRVEMLIIDGGSNPEVLGECKKYGAKIYDNPKKLAEGAGMGKDQGIWLSKGEFVVIAESDIEFMNKDWINKMVKPLKENKEIFASVPGLYINPKDNITNRYLSYIGVDPFACYRSIEGQLTLNRHLKKVKKEGYFILELNKESPYCMGSNGFMFRRELIKEVGDYAQDVEFIGRLAKNNYKYFAVVEDAKVWHKNVKGFKDFLRKRVKWTSNYAKYYITQKKDFNWIDNKPRFLLFITKNLLIIPNIPTSIIKTFKHKDPVWLLHAPFLFISTALNAYFTLTSKNMMKQFFGLIFRN